ncbi:MAG: SurA N-terminal domain-containing protein [Candidatus Tectomicrobia bacterium]|uniref:Periplasmic chaperone PpiD n=1 Tax=Tectimicrobiota bacterium TaxID=2528274 RepID=A0A933LRL9_UNCTE|nr:SurA N-terminal domain-containing protein [Candidatus Tectomicrobia bacterium]
MLDFMRKHAQSWVIKFILWLVVFAFVGTIFLVWGKGKGGFEGDYIAKVRGEAISPQEYQNAYNQIYNLYRQIYKDLNDEMLKSLNLKGMALDRLIQQKLILAEARQLGLKVNDKELMDKLENYPAFQKDGKFSRQRYLEVLKLNRMDPAQFEESEKQAILIGKVTSLIKDSVKVSEQELRDSFRLEKEETKIEYFHLKPDLFKGQVTVSAEEGEKYFQDNKDKFKKPEAVKGKYIFIDPKQFKAQVQVSDEEVKDYYEKHQDEYKEKETVKARHILISLPGGSGEEESNKAKQKIEEVAKEISSGGDFAELAKKYSQDPGSAPKGGELGYFSRETMVKPFSDAAFNLKVGEVSQPVKTQFGYHLIKVEDKKEAQLKDFETAKNEIMTKLEEEKAQALVRDRVEALTGQSYGLKLDELARKNSLEIKETPFFSKTDPIPDIGYSPDLTRLAFSLDKGELSDPVKTPKGYYFFELVEKREAFIPPLEEIKTSVEEAVKLEKAKEIAREKGKELMERVQKGEKLADLAAELQIKSQQTEFFNRMKQGLPNIGVSKEFVQTAFSLKEGDIKLSETVTGVFLIRLVEKKKPTEEDFQKEKESFGKRIHAAKQEQIFNSWQEQLKEQTKARGELKISDKFS